MKQACTGTCSSAAGMSKRILVRILAVCIAAIVITAAVVALCPKATQAPAVEAALVTHDCTDRATTSLRAQGDVTADGGDWVTSRGFQYVEGEGEDFPDIVHVGNSSFEYRDPPDGWDTWLAVLERSTAQVKVGAYSGKLTVGEGDVGGTHITDPIPYGEAEGRTFTFGMWVWSDVANRIRAVIIDRIPTAEVSYSAYHPGDGNWHFLTVTRTLRTDLTRWDVGVRTTGGSGLSYYVDGAFLTEGIDLLAVFEDGEFGTGTYSLEITGLKPDTSYRVRAFVMNVAGISYGNTVTCKAAAGQ